MRPETSVEENVQASVFLMDNDDDNNAITLMIFMMMMLSHLWMMILCGWVGTAQFGTFP